MIKSIKIIFISVMFMLIQSVLYADVIIGNGNIERLNAGVIKDINCQNYTISAGGLLDTSNGGTLREVTKFTNNGTWNFGIGNIKELGAWENNGVVPIKPAQGGVSPNLLFTTLCGSISILGTSDTDGDGISDADEGDNAVALGHGITLDQDGDGIYNFLDDDSDNDGIADSVEGGNNKDTNGNGIPDYLDTSAITPPITADDTKTNQTAGNAVTVNVLENDSEANPIASTTVALDSSSIPGSIGTDTDNDGDIDRIVVSGEGMWTVDPVTGAITFTPEAGFTGDPTPVEYTVKDNIGQISSPATITIDYINAVHAEDDTASANAGDTVTISVLTNDSSDNSLDPFTVVIIDPSTGIGDVALAVAGEGIWSVDTPTGTITFTPEAGFFCDPTPVKYTVTDSEGTVSNKAMVIIDYTEIVTPTPTPCPMPSPTPTPTPTPSEEIHATDNLNVSIVHDGITVIDVLGNGDNFGKNGACNMTFTQPYYGNTSLDDGGTPNDPKDDMILYELEESYQGTDTFEYTIVDCAGESDTAIVTLEIDCSCSESSDSVDTLETISMILMIILMGIAGLFYIKKEEA